MNDTVRPSRQPLLLWRKPWWLLVIAAMIVSGYVQDQSSRQINCYRLTLSEHPQLEGLAPRERATLWIEGLTLSQIGCERFYEKETPWPLLNRASPSLRTLNIINRVSNLGFIVLFFFLDSLFLLVANAKGLRGALIVIYLTTGLLMVLFKAFFGGIEGNQVARELLGFLQSPLPSFMLVFIRWLHARGRQPADTTPT